MAELASAGELRTRVAVFALPAGEPGRNENGYPVEAEPVNVFGEGVYRHCKWVNAHGREVYDALQAGVEEPATLTLRYTPKINAACLIYKKGDPVPYEVISVDDVGERHVWLMLKVTRKGVAR